MSIDQGLMDAYIDYCEDCARRGIISHALDIKILEGKSVEQAMREELIEAGRLPEDWEGCRYDR